MWTQEAFNMTEAFQKGEDKGFTYFYKLLWDVLSYYSFRITNDRAVAEDKVSESFVKIWERHSTFSHPQVIKSWLYTTCRNACLNWLQQEGRHDGHKTGIAAAHENDREFNREEEIVQKETFKQARDYIKWLPKQCKRIFEMMYVEGMSVREIADKLVLSISTVKNQKGRGLEIIRKRMAGMTVAPKPIPEVKFKLPVVPKWVMTRKRVPETEPGPIPMVEPKRRKGRPKGSKNKVVEVSEILETRTPTITIKAIEKSLKGLNIARGIYLMKKLRNAVKQILPTTDRKDIVLRIAKTMTNNNALMARSIMDTFSKKPGPAYMEFKQFMISNRIVHYDVRKESFINELKENVEFYNKDVKLSRTQRRELRVIINAYSEKNKAVLSLLILGKSVPEICEITKSTRTSVMKVVSRLLQRVHKMYPHPLLNRRHSSSNGSSAFFKTMTLAPLGGVSYTILTELGMMNKELNPSKEILTLLREAS